MVGVTLLVGVVGLLIWRRRRGVGGLISITIILPGWLGCSSGAGGEEQHGTN